MARLSDKEEFVLVGAEGVSETEGEKWVRRASKKEYNLWKMVNYNIASVDKTGRPYYLMAINRVTAPYSAIEKAKNYQRVFRLIG